MAVPKDDHKCFYCGTENPDKQYVLFFTDKPAWVLWAGSGLTSCPTHDCYVKGRADSEGSRGKKQ